MRTPKFTARFFYSRANRKLARGLTASAHLDFARAANVGFVPAQHALARAYQIGEGCMRSGSLAKHWYTAAAEAGHIDAQFELGVILLAEHNIEWMAGAACAWVNGRSEPEETVLAALFPSGSSVKSDPAAAFRWLRQAAEGGKPEAQANVGWLYLRGIGCEQSRTQALRWLTAAADREIGQAALGLAEYYGQKDASDFDLGISLAWAKKASAAGNGSGSYLYGLALRDGAGVKCDLAEAEKFFVTAFEQGHRSSAYDAATLALERDPTIEEIEALIERLRVSAKLGHTSSMALLAKLYSRGTHVSLDRREAAAWYLKAADSGDVSSQFVVGCLYSRGDGIECDLQRAVRYFEASAQKGNIEAAFNLGVLYTNEVDATQNRSQAKFWFQLASEAGHLDAKLRLGIILQQEASTDADRAMARLLMKEAAIGGRAEAKILLGQSLLLDDAPNSTVEALSLIESSLAAGLSRTGALLLDFRSSASDVCTFRRRLFRAVKSGSGQLKFILGEALLTENGTADDIKVAIELISDSAGQDVPEAHFTLGVLYCQGRHVEKNIDLGFLHYLTCARSGHAAAEFNAGLMLLRGLGCEQDVKQAVFWLRRAAHNNVPQATEILNAIDTAGVPLCEISS